MKIESYTDLDKLRAVFRRSIDPEIIVDEWTTPTLFGVALVFEHHDKGNITTTFTASLSQHVGPGHTYRHFVARGYTWKHAFNELMQQVGASVIKSIQRKGTAHGNP
jgi:hypothetical protein